MKITTILLIIFVLAACAADPAEDSSRSSAATQSTTATEPTTNTDTPTPETQTARKPASEPVVGERIDGPANIRDAINGKLLFTLNDRVLVSCTPVENDWYQIGVMMDIDTSESDIRSLPAGRQIIVDGRPVGLVKADMEVYPHLGYEEAWVELIGYTHRDNIRPETVIEPALADHLQSANGGRALADLQGFIREFALEKVEQFDGYTLYCNYENWIEDPSPMWRIGLVFQNKRLVAILHTRPLQVAGTTDYQLKRGFSCLVYKDQPSPQNIVKMFNEFVVSVD